MAQTQVPTSKLILDAFVALQGHVFKVRSKSGSTVILERVCECKGPAETANYSGRVTWLTREEAETHKWQE